MEMRNNIIHIEIIRKKKNLNDSKRNTPELRTLVRNINEKDFIQKSLALQSSHHFDKINKKLFCGTPTIKNKKKPKLHVLKFYEKQKDDEKNSFLRMSPKKSFRSLTPIPNPNLKVLTKLPTSPENIIIASSEYRLKHRSKYIKFSPFFGIKND